MKIRFLSDLHIEFGAFEFEEGAEDLIIFAGDVHTKEKGLLWILENVKKTPVVYVLGNHEYYGKAYPKLIDSLKSLSKGSHVKILENESWVFYDLNILGCTLWTDYKLLGNPIIAGNECLDRMSDFKKIRISPNYGKIKTSDFSKIHLESKKWLEKEMANIKKGKTLIVTHHSPSPKSLSDKIKHNVISSAYASNLEYLILQLKPDFWFHGHCHSSSDYTIGKTRVLCNPRGYSDELNPSFNPKLLLSI